MSIVDQSRLPSLVLFKFHSVQHNLMLCYVVATCTDTWKITESIRCCCRIKEWIQMSSQISLLDRYFGMDDMSNLHGFQKCSAHKSHFITVLRGDNKTLENAFTLTNQSINQPVNPSGNQPSCRGNERGHWKRSDAQTHVHVRWTWMYVVGIQVQDVGP